MSEFDEAMPMVSRESTSHQVEIGGGWGIAGVPNGGYLMALGAHALSKLVAHPDPLTVTARYARPTMPGPAELRFELIKQGRRQSAGVVKFLQNGKETCRVSATFGDLSTRQGPTLEPSDSAPEMPEPETLRRHDATPLNSTFGDRVDIRFAPGTVPFLDGGFGPMEIDGWVRLADGRDPDPFVLLLLADALPPPVLNGIEPRVWVPTVELTVHIRRRPTPGWVKARFRTRYLIEGALEEDGELWDAEGRLVALARQYAQLAQPSK